NQIIRLGLDLCGAYELALRAVSSPLLPGKFRLLRASHKRHFDLLRWCVLSLGGKPAQSESLRGLVERGRVLLGELRGDEGIMRAMAINEAAYRVALRNAIK